MSSGSFSNWLHKMMVSKDIFLFKYFVGYKNMTVLLGLFRRCSRTSKQTVQHKLQGRSLLLVLRVTMRLST